MQQVLFSFELLGFRVNVRPAFLLVAVLIPYLSRVSDPLAVLGWMVVIFGSIIVHELGHAVTARTFGYRVGAIELHGMGGHVTHAATARVPHTPPRLLAISVAGPAAGLLLGFAVLSVDGLLAPSGALAREIVGALLWVNIGWSLFNLLPVLPLDGGNALRAGAAIFTSERTSWRIAAGSSMLVGGLGTAWALMNGQIFLTFFGAWVAYRGYQMFQQAGS